MKLHEKIKEIRLKKNLSLNELHRLIFNDFKENTVTYRTLLRIEAGDTDGRASTLHQISTALGISLSELKKDTEEENKPIDFIKRNKRLGRYVFNERAYAELLIRQNRNFMVTELVLEPQGKTRLEQDPQAIPKENNPETPTLKFEKYIYCLRGSVACYIGKDIYILRYGDGLVFGSSTPHWFENHSKSESRCLIFQNPRYL